MKIDLHCHSHYSDGKHSPGFLVQLAIENRVSHLAITDHDCIAALTEAEIELEKSTAALKLISGVEISCDWEGSEIHVLGLWFDPKDRHMGELLGRQQDKRRRRVLKMHELLQSQGDYDLMAYLNTLPCHAVSRSHVADYLVDQGICKNRQKAFKTQLGKGGRLYVEAHWCALEQAITTINDGGGIAVLAHPGRYPLGKHALQSLVAAFAGYGGEAMEVSYGNIDPKTQRRLADLAVSKSLYASIGSDFHDAAAHWTTIGKAPPLENGTRKNAIWAHPGWQS